MGFQYNGITSQSMNIKAHLTGWQMVPSLRSNTETVPGKAGLADFGADSGERYIDVACNVYPQKTFSDMVAVLDQVAAWLDPTAGTKQLVLDDVPDRYFMARLSDTVDCERLLRAAGSFNLRFLCADPYGYALDDETFTLSQAGEHEVEREIGNTDSEPVYSLQGTISFGAVVLTTNGENCEWLARWLRGSAGNRHRHGNGQSDGQRGQYPAKALPCLEELNFPVLRRGVNEVEIAVEGGAVFTELHIQAKSRWR
ncbi:MAG: distal tail protein Dit [Hydrogeniiclostridium mannosilyticum]